MNPARSFGPALYNMNFTSHWIYWAAPLSSALITAVAFKAVFSHKQESLEQSQSPEETVRLNDVKSNARN
jgi:aquaporin rerated protein, invertebrate